MPIRLDERLQYIANLVDYGTVADIGCDHGKLGYYLINTDRASFIIDTDISAPSLKKAKDLALENGVEKQIDCRLCDGLTALKSEEVDTVVIAGLGGDVISNILLDAQKENKKFNKYILSANTHTEKVREALQTIKQRIIVDELIECSGKLYSIIKTEEGEQSLDDMQIEFGVFYKENEAFKSYARKQIEHLTTIFNSNKESIELKNKIQRLKDALGE